MKHLSAYMSLVLMFFVIACDKDTKPTQSTEPSSVGEVSTQSMQQIPHRAGKISAAPTEFEDLGDITTFTDARFIHATLDGDAGTVKYYGFTLAVRKTVGLGLRRQETNADLFLEDDNGMVIKSSRETGTADEWLVARVPAGTYYVRIEAQEAGASEYVFRYGVIEKKDDYGHKISAAAEMPYYQYNSESDFLEAKIDYAHDRDWFKTPFPLHSGGRYRIDILPVSLSAEDVTVKAFHVGSPDLLAKKVVHDTEDWVSFYVTSLIHGGVYVEVMGNGEATGSYGIRFVNDPLRVWSGSEQGDLPADETTWAIAEVGGTETGQYIYNGDHDWFAVELEGDTNYLIRAVKKDDDDDYTDPVVKLFDSDGNELAVDYDSGIGNNAWLLYSIAPGSGGTYYIEVTSATLLDLGSLDGILEEGFVVNPTPFTGGKYFLFVDTWSDDCGASISSSCSLTADGTSHSGSIQAQRDHDWFRVSLVAGTAYVIIVRGSTSVGLEKPKLTVRAPSTSSLSEVTDTADGMDDIANVTYVPDVTGEYIIIVSDDDEMDLGAYGVLVTAL